VGLRGLEPLTSALSVQLSYSLNVTVTSNSTRRAGGRVRRRDPKVTHRSFVLIFLRPSGRMLPSAERGKAPEGLEEGLVDRAPMLGSIDQLPVSI
jgi:hypothetical protein